MHFACKCGNRISNTTDHLPYAAHLIADVDAEDYWEAWERRGRGQSLGSLDDPFDYEKEVYQCDECGRVYFEHPNEPWRFISFAPEDENIMITGPVAGDKWKGFIYGFSDERMPYGINHTITWNYGMSEESRCFDSYEKMREHFDAKVNELKSDDRLESAWIIKDGETIYRWRLEDDLPVQQKWELYLTDDEAREFSLFESEHAECRRDYPRGFRGWNFSYEVLPGVCGADDRDIRVACLRCGAYLDSVDGKIQKHAKGVDSKKSLDDFENKILDLLHERAFREVRSETISQPGRNHDVAEAIGYVRGLIDAAKLLNQDTALMPLFQHVIKELSQREQYMPEVRNLIRSASSGDPFDWVLEDAYPSLVDIMKREFPGINPGWIDDEPKARDR